VAETKKVKVIQNIFLQVYFPYDVIEDEQTSVRVVIFNNEEEDIDVSYLTFYI